MSVGSFRPVRFPASLFTPPLAHVSPRTALPRGAQTGGSAALSRRDCGFFSPPTIPLRHSMFANSHGLASSPHPTVMPPEPLPCPAWGYQRPEDRDWVRRALKPHTHSILSRLVSSLHLIQYSIVNPISRPGTSTSHQVHWLRVWAAGCHSCFPHRVRHRDGTTISSVSSMG